jgi:hypothetical protein
MRRNQKMNLEEIKERFRSTPAEANRMEEFLKKAENAQVLYCSDHDREWFDFEGGCPGCLGEKLDFEQSMKHHKDNGSKQEDLEQA